MHTVVIAISIEMACYEFCVLTFANNVIHPNLSFSYIAIFDDLAAVVAHRVTRDGCVHFRKEVIAHRAPFAVLKHFQSSFHRPFLLAVLERDPAAVLAARHVDQPQVAQRIVVVFQAGNSNVVRVRARVIHEV